MWREGPHSYDNLVISEASRGGAPAESGPAGGRLGYFMEE